MTTTTIQQLKWSVARAKPKILLEPSMLLVRFGVLTKNLFNKWMGLILSTLTKMLSKLVDS